MGSKIERWAIITGHENYAVSTRGRVRNLNTGRLLKHLRSERGGNYAFVDLRNKGNRRVVNVHILVADAFIGPRGPGTLVHHEDNNRMNPRIENLEIVTIAENNQRENRKNNK